MLLVSITSQSFCEGGSISALGIQEIMSHKLIRSDIQSKVSITVFFLILKDFIGLKWLYGFGSADY
jgi:hypothetical protein